MLSKKNQEITERSPSFSNVLARLTGEAGSLVQDPVIIGSLMFGNGPGKLYQLALNQAIIGAGSEALIQNNVKNGIKALALNTLMHSSGKRLLLVLALVQHLLLFLELVARQYLLQAIR